MPLSYHRLCVGRLRLNGSAWVAPPPRMRTPLLPKGGVWVAIVNKSRRLPRCEPRSCSLRKPQRFRRVGAKTCFGGCALMQQGRQECRPSDGPATLLSPMVGLESCFFEPRPKLVLVGELPCSRGDKSVAHPTDRRHSCRRWWPRRRASLPHHPPSRAPMKQLLQIVGGPRKLFLRAAAKTCFGGCAARKLDSQRGGV